MFNIGRALGGTRGRGGSEFGSLDGPVRHDSRRIRHSLESGEVHGGYPRSWSDDRYYQPLLATGNADVAEESGQSWYGGTDDGWPVN